MTHLRYYTFYQNNSGGVWINNNTMTHIMIVQAEDHEHANALAQALGIYFDGVFEGLDCECCGDRWSPQWSKDEGTEEPMIWGQAPKAHSWLEAAPAQRKQVQARVFHLDGRVDEY
jgi:hypothetical protein